MLNLLPPIRAFRAERQREPHQRIGCSWWMVCLGFLIGVPLSGFALLITYFSIQCGAWRSPMVWPYTAPTVTVTRINASLSSMTTTRRYRIHAARTVVEQYYRDQMQWYCQRDSIEDFTTVNNPATGTNQRQAACRIRGVPPPEFGGTMEQWDKDPDVRRRFYESVKGTTQRFHIEIVTISDTEQEVLHIDDISSICSY